MNNNKFRNSKIIIKKNKLVIAIIVIISKIIVTIIIIIKLQYNSKLIFKIYNLIKEKSICKI